MGLLDSVQKKKDVKIETEVIKKHIEKAIKKAETSSVQEPSVHFKDNKVHTFRPSGTLNELQNKESGKIDLASIKSEIQSEMKKKPAATADNDKNRVQTGIPGLDGVMSGGFRKNSVNLIAGGPGSGKTIFAAQFLVNGIEQDEPAVYVSFEQTQDEFLSDMKHFGWNLEDKIDKKKLVVMTYTPEQVEKVLKSGGGAIMDVIQSIKAKRVVIDSLTAFTLLHEDALAQRKACLALFEAIKKWGCTALLLSEQEGNPELHSPTVEEFEVDGVILLYNVRKGDVRQRALEVFKMRGASHSAKIFPMTVSDQGVVIYPDQTVF